MRGCCRVANGSESEKWGKCKGHYAIKTDIYKHILLEIIRPSAKLYFDKVQLHFIQKINIQNQNMDTVIFALFLNSSRIILGKTKAKKAKSFPLNFVCYLH